MKVSGFSLARNAIKYFYPFREAVLSVLPLCDEFIVNIGDSEDKTRDIIASLSDNKIKIVDSVWDMNNRQDGTLLAVETNKALKECTGDWCFYIQADEVIHEKYYDAIREAMDFYLNKKEIKGLRFKYKHFYGSYDYIQDNYRRWYKHEVRIIRNNCGIMSWGDAMGFKYSSGREFKLIDIPADIYHYGWVRPPDIMMMKRINFEKLYHTDSEMDVLVKTYSNFDEIGHLKKFTDTHPLVMQERVKQTNWDFDARLGEQPPDFIRKISLFFQPVTKRIKKLKKKK